MCINKTFGTKSKHYDADMEDDFCLIGYAAYRVNSACLPGSPLWCEYITKESLSSISKRYMSLYEASPEEAEHIQPPFNVVRDESSDVVMGSEVRMWSYLGAKNGEALEDFTLLPVNFGEIVIGMYLSGAYSLDEEAYNRFCPLAQKHGYGARPHDFSVSDDSVICVVKVEFEGN
jgi:hypothetical protein